MKDLAIVGNFKGDFIIDDARSGLRDSSITFGLADHLKQYFNVKCYDASTFTKDCGISRLIGSKPNRNIFIIQNHINFIIDGPKANVFYLHIDGAQSIHPNFITFAFYLFNAIGRHDYKICEKQINILPFANVNSFNPTREKDLHFSDIPREVTFEEYRDILERSEFTLVKTELGLSKRVPEAFACKTIPIIMTKALGMQKLYSRDHAPIIPYGGNISQAAKDYTQERVDKAYEFLLKNHTLKLRVKKMLPYLKKYAQ